MRAIHSLRLLQGIVAIGTAGFSRAALRRMSPHTVPPDRPASEEDNAELLSDFGDFHTYGKRQAVSKLKAFK